MNIEANKIQSSAKNLNSNNQKSVLAENEKTFKDELVDLKKDNVNQSQTDLQNNDFQVLNSNSNLLQMHDISARPLNNNQNLVDTLNGETIENEEIQSMLNNDFSVSVPQEKIPELKADINFANQNGEMFSSFMKDNTTLQETIEEMQEDIQALSSMAENMAMLNKAAVNVSQIDEVGVVVDRVIDAKSLNLTVVDVNLVLNLISQKVSFNDVIDAQEQTVSKVSETLANMLAESMKNNKAFRLNFDNDISVIIRVSREGRISANFLPATDVAENYLKNNLLSLVQRFEEENIPYDELSHQRQRRENNQQNNKKEKRDE